MSRDYLAIATQYADDVIDGVIPANEYVKLACLRYRRDLERVQTDPDFDYVLSADRADHACRFIERMPHIKAYAGAGRNLGSLVMLSWQVFVTVNLFGWINRVTGLRRFMFCYIEVAKKNGKSTWLSAVCIYMATGDGEMGAEVYTVATNYDQAKIVWLDAKAMINKLPRLASTFNIKDTIYEIRCGVNNAVFKPLATDKGGSKDGYNIHCAAVDELHAHKDSLTYDIVANGIASRAQPLVIAITTAGTDTTGVAYRERTVVTQVLTQQAEHDRYFGMIFCLDRGDDWRDESNWVKSNPSLGHAIKIDYLRDKYKKVTLSPSAEFEFRQKSLNEWVGVRSQWINQSDWDALADHSLVESDLIGNPAFGSLDIASRNDLAGFGKLYAGRVEGQTKPHWYFFSKQYINEKAAQNAAQRLAQAEATRSREVGNAMYAVWAAEGWLTVTDGNTTDQDVIERDIKDSHNLSPFVEFGFDNFNASMIAGHLIEAGVPMVDVPMRVNPLSPAMRWIESLIADGRLHHNGDPVLSWCMSNVTVKPDANDNLFPRKDSAENKIDAALALITAAARAMFYDDESVFSYQASGSAEASFADYLNDFVSVSR